MKKHLALIPAFILLGASIYGISTLTYNYTAVMAEGESEVEPEMDEEKFTEKAKEWLSQYMDSQMVANIITWASEGTLMVGLFTVYLKYRKYKSTSIEDLFKMFKSGMEKYLKDSFDKLSKEQISNIIKSVEMLEKSNETLMKALILMQDKTAEGKIALIDFLGSKTNSEEVKEAAESISETVEEAKKSEEEVKEAVSGDYENIF